MLQESISCINCGGSLQSETLSCYRCNAKRDGSNITEVTVRCSQKAREAGWKMGGLLKLIPVSSGNIAFIGFCAGGLFGLDSTGECIWEEDWGYVGSVTWINETLWVDGHIVDPATGKLMPSSI